MNHPNEWISVDEALPEKEGEYRVKISNAVDVINHETVCKFNGIFFYDVIGMPPVTHWMKIEPPKEKEIGN